MVQLFKMLNSLVQCHRNIVWKYNHVTNSHQIKPIRKIRFLAERLPSSVVLTKRNGTVGNPNIDIKY